MRPLIATLIIALMSFTTFMPISSANDIKEYSGFSVTEILSIDEGEADGSHVEGTETITQSFIDLVKEDDNVDNVVVAVLLRIINILTLLIGTFAFVMIIIGGFFWATSSGNETQIDKGKAILLQAIMGLIIAFMSYFIVTFILSFFY